MDALTELQRRILVLEARERTLRFGCVGLVMLTAALTSLPGSQAQQPAGPLRVRGLIVEDAGGRDRIVLGAPMPGSSGRSGIRINDSNGVERMGLSLTESGSIVLGLDAPVGTGDDRNRERITLVADDKGGAALRMKDRRTSVVSSWYLDEENRGWFEFSDYMQTPPIRRRSGLTGDETITGTR